MWPSLALPQRSGRKALHSPTTWCCPLPDYPRPPVEVVAGLGRIVALSYHSSTLYQIYSAPEFLRRQCDRTLGKLSRAFAAVDELVYKDAKVPAQCPPGYSRLFFVVSRLNYWSFSK